MKKHLIFLMTALFVCGAIFLFANPAKAAALTSVTVEPKTDNVDNLIGQTSATWRFTIDNVTALSTSTDAVEITFPEITDGPNWNLSNSYCFQHSPWRRSLEFCHYHFIY